VDPYVKGIASSLSQSNGDGVSTVQVDAVPPGSPLSPHRSIQLKGLPQDRFDFMFYTPDSQGLSPINSTAVSPTGSYNRNAAAQQQMTGRVAPESTDADLDLDFAIERPNCSPSFSNTAPKPPCVPHQQLNGFKPLVPHRQVVAGFEVSPNSSWSEGAANSSGATGEQGAQGSSYRSPASSLVNQVTKKAASLWGSALDLVSLGNNSPANQSDSETSPVQSRKSSLK
jgi:hypothetical protein